MRKMAGNCKTKPNVKGHYSGFEEIFRDLVVIPAPCFCHIYWQIFSKKIMFEIPVGYDFTLARYVG